MNKKLLNIVLASALSTTSMCIFASQMNIHSIDISPNINVAAASLGNTVSGINSSQLNVQINKDTSQVTNVVEMQVGQIGQAGLINVATAGSGIGVHAITLTGANVNTIGNYNGSSITVSPVNTSNIASSTSTLASGGGAPAVPSP